MRARLRERLQERESGRTSLPKGGGTALTVLPPSLEIEIIPPIYTQLVLCSSSIKTGGVGLQARDAVMSEV